MTSQKYSLSFPYHWISRDPPILHAVMLPRWEEKELRQFAACLPSVQLTILVSQWWHKSAQEITLQHSILTKLCPSVSIKHMCNEECTNRELRQADVPAVHINQNALIDERIFKKTKQECEPVFDAVYLARMSQIKRHYLAELIPSVLFVGGIACEEDSIEYFDAVRTYCRNGEFTHLHEPNKVYPPSWVAEKISLAGVGLCLSAVEGGMYASVEYLLCGLPVVNTENRGGRDEWLHPAFTKTVVPDGEAVASAVCELRARCIDGEWIRSSTLELMLRHRHRFYELGQDIFHSYGSSADFCRAFWGNFTNKMLKWGNASNLTSQLFETNV